jgi:hypothetical protein
MAQRVLDPAPPLLDHNMYRYQMSGGPSYVGMDNPPAMQETSPLGSIMGLRHQLPATFPVSPPDTVQAQPIGPSYEELTAQGFRGAEVRPNAATRGEATPEGVPNGFDQGRFGPEFGSPQWGGEEVGSSSADPAMAPPPADAGAMSQPPSSGGMGRLGPILNGLGAGIAANNMGVGVGVMNNRRDIAYRRQQYEYERSMAERAAAEERRQKEAAANATVGYLEKTLGADDPRVQLARANPEAAGMLLREALQPPEKPTPYTDAAKAKSDLQNGLISKEMYEQMVSTAGLVASPDYAQIGTTRKEYLTNPAVQLYDVTRSQYENIMDAAQRAYSQPNGQSAITLMYSYMKMLDPNTGIKEGEVALAENAGSVPERVWGLYNKIVNGQQFPASQLREYVENAQMIYKRRAEDLHRINRYYEGIRDSARIPQQLFPMIEVREYQPPTLPDKTISPEAETVPQSGGAPGPVMEYDPVTRRFVPVR